MLCAPSRCVADGRNDVDVGAAAAYVAAHLFADGRLIRVARTQSSRPMADMICPGVQ